MPAEISEQERVNCLYITVLSNECLDTFTASNLHGLLTVND